MTHDMPNTRNITLANLVEQLQNNNARKRDLIVPASALSMRDGKIVVTDSTGFPPALRAMLNANGVTIGDPRDGRTVRQMIVAPTAHCDGQIAARLDIDKRYYDKCRAEAVPALDWNVNYWLNARGGNVFLRSFSPVDDEGVGIARAFLSDRYRVIDHLDVLLAALEAIKATGARVEITSSDLTETRMYVRVIAPDIEVSAPALLEKYRVPGSHNFPGNPFGVVSGFVFGNSEVGKGSFFVAPRAQVLVCQNGLIRTNEALKKVHLGGRLDEGVIEWSEETRRQSMLLIMNQIKDAVRTFLSKEYLGRVVQDLTDKGTEPLAHPVDAVKNVCKFYDLNDDKTKSVLDFFIAGADTTAFGLSQAVTYFAHESDDGDEQFALEAAGVEIVERAKSFDVPYKERAPKLAASKIGDMFEN